MVNVYKTNVNNPNQAALIVQTLQNQLPGRIINFDLEDCDKILRVEGWENDSPSIINFLNQIGFYCDELLD
jgi:hypothetical protein